MHMAYKLMEQKSQARDARILEGKKRKWENFQSRNSSGKSNNKDNSRQSSQNNQKQGNARAMITSLTGGKVSSGSLPMCKCCFTRHVLTLNLFGLVMIVGSKVIRGTDAQSNSSKMKLKKFMAELMLLRMLSCRVRMWLR
ncbi:hypothetical protein Tco_0280162, partial [Tanacetum coccineum]